MIQKTMDDISVARTPNLVASSWALVMAKVPHVDVFVDQDRLYEGAAEVLASIRPCWKPSEIKYKLFTDGITNKLVHCSVPDDVLLIRVYGQNTDLLIDRGAEVRNIKLLQHAGFAPQLYATFNNGLAYEFAPGSTLDTKTVRDPDVYPLVARTLARLHAVEAAEVVAAAGEPRPLLWDVASKYLTLLQSAFKEPSKKHRFEQEIGGLQRLESELHDLRSHLSPLGSPLVMCHNDLLLANVILDPTRSKVTFIDYEYAGINYQAFDIGNHFAEFAGVAVVDYSLYPHQELQYKWLEIYLQEFNRLKGFEGSQAKVLSKDTRRLFVQVNKFSLASHYLWGLWALVQSEHSAIDFDFFDYAKIRLNEYFAKKSEFLSLQESS